MKDTRSRQHAGSLYLIRCAALHSGGVLGRSSRGMLPTSRAPYRSLWWGSTIASIKHAKVT